MSIKVPTDEQMEIAADWLKQNESGDEEQEACFVVSEWLGRQLTKKALRKAAKEFKVPVKRLYDKLGV